MSRAPALFQTVTINVGLVFSANMNQVHTPIYIYPVRHDYLYLLTYPLVFTKIEEFTTKVKMKVKIRGRF